MAVLVLMSQLSPQVLNHVIEFLPFERSQKMQRKKGNMQRPTKPSWGAPNIIHIPHIHWVNTDSAISLLSRPVDPHFALYRTRTMGQLFPPLLIFSIAVNFSSFIIGSDLWVRTTGMTPMHAADRFVWSYFLPHSDGPISPSLCYFFFLPDIVTNVLSKLHPHFVKCFTLFSYFSEFTLFL